MIDFPPGSVAVQLGPLPVYWYGIAYAVGLAVAYAVMVGQAKRLGVDPTPLGNGLIIVAVAALIGGRLYHVIDQFYACGPGQPCYSQDLLKIVLPPYSGLGGYGGLVTRTLAAIPDLRPQHPDFFAVAHLAVARPFTIS